MKAYQNEEGKIVVDGEGIEIKITKGIPSDGVLLTGFHFIGNYQAFCESAEVIKKHISYCTGEDEDKE